MNESEYIEQRLDDQIAWYSNRSQSNQKFYKRLRTAELIAAASIPFLAGYMTLDTLWIRIVAGLLGVVVTITAGILSLYRFHENWIMYRTTAESLKHEKALFLTKTDPYDGPEPFALLVKRVESIISRENTEWAHTTDKHKTERT